MLARTRSPGHPYRYSAGVSTFALARTWQHARSHRPFSQTASVRHSKRPEPPKNGKAMTEPPSSTPSGESAPPPPPPGYVPPPPPPGYGTPPPPGYPPQAQGGPGGWSVGNAFTYGWQKFTQNLGPLVLLALAILAAGIVVYVVRLVFVGALDVGSDGDNGFFSALLFVSLAFGLVQWIIGQLIAAGVAKASLEIVDGRRPEIGTAFQGYSLGQVLLASILTGLIVFVGLFLCVLPGIIAGFLLSFTTYFVVDRGMTATQAIQASFEFTSQRVGQLVLFFLAMFAALLVGAC